jgi:hypothetical protein
MWVTAESLTVYCDSRCMKCAEVQELCVGNVVRLSISKAGEDLATSHHGHVICSIAY